MTRRDEWVLHFVCERKAHPEMKTLSTLIAVYRDALKRLVTVKCYDTCAMYTAFCVALPPTLKQWETQ